MRDDAGLYIIMEPIRGGDEALIVYAASAEVQPEMREADANLVAAAPDLLAVCERIAAGEFLGQRFTPIELRDALTAAIDKARGEAVPS